MIKDLIGKQLLFFDGAMATELQKAGLKTGELPDIWNIMRPEVIKNIHKKYLAAGCDIIKTNTFGCNTRDLKETGDLSVRQVVLDAVYNAKEAVAEYNTDKPRYVALDVGPSGKLLKPLGDLYFEDAIDIFAKTIKSGAEAGADLVLIETMSDSYELKAAVLAAKENCNLPVIASVTLNENGRLMTGGGIEVVAALLEGLGVDAIGLNCGFGLEQWMPHLKELLKISSTPIMFMPNAGLPFYKDGEINYNIGPEEYAQVLRKTAENGVWLLGGCCGTTPKHIETLVKNCANVVPPPVTRKASAIASSYGKIINFDASKESKKLLIIGERINPTGKPKLRQALKDEHYEYALREAITQTEQGAHVLDVNAGVPGIDEKTVLKKLIEQIQTITDTPLQIDTADINAMEDAMRIYNGKPVINSVNGKTSSMDAVFPLLKKYGGIAVALTLDEKGIPETAQGRMDIAKKILKHAEQYGISKEDFLFDPLTMAVSAGQDNALITLECVKRLKEELGVKTILGVSNISFGLPCREVLNNAFLKLAIEAGLNVAIKNPVNSEQLTVNSEHQEIAIDALLGKDDQFANYIEVYGTQKTDKKTDSISSQDNLSLHDAVLKGLKTQAQESASVCLTKLAPLEIIEQELIPALNTAGDRYEKGSMYLPQLLMCAEAAKSAFSVIRKVIGKDASNNKANESLGTIVLATVEGDIHDIGKNIVHAILENYRYNIIDLGKDVPAQTIVEAVKKHNAKLVGLSALMTTTVINMEKTILALRDAGLDCKIICGGAVLTEEYAKDIGADCYGKDAMAAVRYAQAALAASTIISTSTTTEGSHAQQIFGDKKESRV